MSNLVMNSPNILNPPLSQLPSKFLKKKQKLDFMHLNKHRSRWVVENRTQLRTQLSSEPFDSGGNKSRNRFKTQLWTQLSSEPFDTCGNKSRNRFKTQLETSEARPTRAETHNQKKKKKETKSENHTC